MAYDVIIIGGGIIGSAAAYRLVHKGLRVALVDDGRPGATEAAAGMLSPSFENEHERPEGVLGDALDASLSRWDDFAQEISDDPYAAFGYRRDGIYGTSFPNPPSGTESYTDDARFAAFSVAPSVWAPNEGAAEPVPLRRVLRSRAGALGLTLIRGRAEAIGQRQCTVDGQHLSADTIIVTTGAALQDKVTPVRGQALHVRLAEEDQGAVPYVVRSPQAYFCPRRDGTLYIGATEEWPGQEMQDPLRQLEDEALKLLPCLIRGEIISRFDGLRPFISSAGPFIDWLDDGVLAAVGHHRNGVLLAPWTADLLALKLGV
ncbi:MAG: FAD-dependent oxidoreductase [Pseudomonadota bacterium]